MARSEPGTPEASAHPADPVRPGTFLLVRAPALHSAGKEGRDSPQAPALFSSAPKIGRSDGR